MTNSFFVCGECHKGEPCILYVVGTEGHPDACPFDVDTPAPNWVWVRWFYELP